jgi:protein TonB
VSGLLRRRVGAAAVFIAMLLFAGPQPSRSPVLQWQVVSPTNLAPVLAPPPPSRPLSPSWRGAVRATPRKLKHVDPVYPEGARQERIQGDVIVEILIDEGGAVEDARVIRSIGLLDQAVLDAVWQWRFTPSLLNDQPVKVILTVRVQFALRG